MDYIVRYNDSADSLQHYGIKGQQYGVRRFQNEDGSLTPAGKLRYGYGEARAAIDSRKEIAGVAGAGGNLAKETAKAGAREAKRDARDAVLTKKEDAEIAARKLDKNRTLKERLASAVNGPEARRGRRHVADTLARIGDGANVAGAAAKYGLAQLKLAYKMDKSRKKYGIN